MVKAVDEAAKAVGHVNYERSELEEVNAQWRRSLYASKDIKMGEVFSLENCKSVRPAHGLAPKYLAQLLGSTARRNIAFGTPIMPEDLHND